MPQARPQLPAERAGPRLALLIGISSYPEADAPLIAPKNDARVLAGELKRIGFEVEVAEDLSKGGLYWAIENFKKRIKPGSTALFFFSGYGLQANRQTYLIPADAQIWREADVARDGTNLETVLADMNGQGAAVFEAQETLSADRFDGNRAADYRLELPMSRLSRGPYLLSIEARRSERDSARRAVPFRVE